jgi:hypothetical protein
MIRHGLLKHPLLEPISIQRNLVLIIKIHFPNIGYVLILSSRILLDLFPSTLKIQKYTHARTHTHMYVCVCMCVYIYMYIYIYIYIYIYKFLLPRVLETCLAIISLNSINYLTFVMETSYVFFAARTEFLNTIGWTSGFKELRKPQSCLFRFHSILNNFKYYSN